MTERLGFGFDAASCSGCKACQAACKDKHSHRVGTLFRRVYEVEGGMWRRRGDAWLQDVFAYYLSLSCHHCEKPICVEACPSGAMRQGADGVVSVDERRCLGCGYCAWACPYGAPQLDDLRGHMTKCDLCADDRALGKPPACVAACPMRALDVGPVEELAARLGPRGPVFPLADPRLTEPCLYLRRHPAFDRAHGEPEETKAR